MKAPLESYTDDEIIDEDNPEWTEENFKNAVPFSALPEDLQVILQGLKKQKIASPLPLEHINQTV